MSESVWIERAQSAEARLKTCQDNMDRVKEDARTVLDTLGAKKRSDGTFVIDYDKLVNNLGIEGALEIRSIIDATYKISGEPGQKPRVRL